MSEPLTPERLREFAEIAEAEAETRHGRLMLELIDHLTWMGNKVTEALHALGTENNPKKALDILYAAYRRYHDELKGKVTDCA